MANLFTFLAFISNFFCFISAVFSRIFVSQVRSIPKTDIEAGAPGAIEAGAPTASDAKTSPACAHWYKHDIESGLLCSKSCADFVDMEYEAIPFGSPIRGAGSSAELGPKVDVSDSSACSSAGDSCSKDSISQLPAVLRSERRVKKRGSLFDLIAQFPDVPRHLPPRPNALTTCSSPATSSEQSRSADDTPDTSAPGSPETQVDDDFFGLSPEAAPLSQGKDNMAGFRFGGNHSVRNCLAEPLRWSQFDDTEVGFDTLLAQLSGSESFVGKWTSTGRRPGSLVWFADASLNLPATSQVAILCIVKKGECKPTEVEDEVVVRELIRWEESKRLGLKALREAKGHGFFGLASRGP